MTVKDGTGSDVLKTLGGQHCFLRLRVATYNNVVEIASNAGLKSSFTVLANSFV